jgi:hypothetical protein
VSWLDTAVLLGAIAAEAIVFALLVRRKVWRILPLFCVYVAWTCLSDAASYLVISKFSAETYRGYYLIQISIDSLLQFAVLVELMWSVLRPIRASLPRSTPIVLGALMLLVGLVIWPLAGLTVPPKFTDEAALLFHVQETVAILRVVCFLLMASFSQLLSIGWRDRELQVATGLGFYSIISLIIAVMHSHLVAGLPYTRLDQVGTVSYLGTLAYWIFSFAAQEQKRKEFSPQMQQFLLQMGGGARVTRVALSELPSERPRKRIE